MQISTDGRCPSCGSYKFTLGISTDGNTVSCYDCCIYYIRLTGADAILYRKSNPEKPGIFTGAAIIDATNETLDFEKKLESAWKTSELSECVSLLEKITRDAHKYECNPKASIIIITITVDLLNEARTKIESLKKFLATKV